MADPKTYTQDEMDAIIAERDAAKNHNAELFKEAKKAKDALKAWDGKDPARYDQLLAASEEAERKKAAAEGDFNTLKKQLVDNHQKEIEAREAKAAKLTRALEKRKVAKLTESLAKAEALPDMMELLVLKGSASVRLRETDDDFEEFVADEKGNPLVADGKGTPMDLDTFVVQKLKTQYPGAFKGTGSSGGGATKSTAGGGGAKVIAAGDNAAFLANLDKIAKGEVEVR